MEEVILFGAVKGGRGLRFRDLENYNKALLVKQLWRVIDQPSSFVAQALKDKYFKEACLLHAKLGPNPSFIWRSL